MKPKRTYVIMLGSQKLPARLMCNPPARIPPTANPKFVGIRIDPAEAGDHPRTAMA